MQQFRFRFSKNKVYLDFTVLMVTNEEIDSATIQDTSEDRSFLHGWDTNFQRCFWSVIKVEECWKKMLIDS